MSLWRNASAFLSDGPREIRAAEVLHALPDPLRHLSTRFGTSILPTFSKKRSFTRTYHYRSVLCFARGRLCVVVVNLDFHLAAVSQRPEVAAASNTHLNLTFDSRFSGTRSGSSICLASTSAVTLCSGSLSSPCSSFLASVKRLDSVRLMSSHERLPSSTRWLPLAAQPLTR